MKTRLQKTFSFLLILALMCAGVELPVPKVVHAITCGAGSDIGGGQCRVFLTSGTSWTVPADWSSTNTVEAIGGGGNGTAAIQNTRGGASGGGGGYSKSVNLTGLSGSVTIQVGGAAQDTWFNSASFPSTGQAVGAKGGTSAVGGSSGTGGAAASGYATGTGSAKFSGGSFGGGAGGPNGNGGDGGSPVALEKAGES